MGIVRYLRWRLSPAGKAVYADYARAMQGQRALSPAPCTGPAPAGDRPYVDWPRARASARQRRTARWQGR